MNKRERLVQEAFLDNEEEVIKQLKNIYKLSLRDIELKIIDMQEQINNLQGYIDTAENGKKKAQFQSMQQSKIYQKQYQEALKKQISSILDMMHVEEFKTIEVYLQKCYYEGFLGTMYDLHGQGIPIIMPIDQETVVQAVQTDSKISSGLYSHLGENVNTLKKTITSEISRGISTGMSYAQIAQQISYKMIGTYKNPGGSYAYALRIARTEGHRIQNRSAMDACYKAKEKGCNVVKQWDATEDKRVRETHKRVHGEIRELDEKFSNGLMYPGDSNGRASEVVNCRCALLQRARWALDEEELELLKKRAEYYGLDKTEEFEEFKKKYLKAAEDIEKSVTNGKIEIPKEKFVNYALNPQKAPDKAKAFKEALGYDLDNYEELIDNIDKHIVESKFIKKGDNGYGMRFEQIMELTGANGKKANVLTAWIENEKGKRLTSVYVTKKKVE